MEFDVKIGAKFCLEKIVDKNETASKYGSGMVEVFATPAVVAFMENTARGCVDSNLPNGFTTVGIEINTKHMKATPVGRKVKCEVVIEKVEGKKIFFKVDAWDEKGKIGQGTHIRYIINEEEFMKKINK